MNIMMLLEMAAGAFGERTAIGRRDGSGFTYQQLFDRSASAAALFAQESRDNVVFLDVSSPALPVALFGAACAGKPFVPLNYRLSDVELRAVSSQVAPSVTVCNNETSAVLGPSDGVRQLLREDFLDSTGSDPLPPTSWNNDPEAVAVLLYTSGTTGSPKAAVLRHKHLVSYILGSVEFMGAGEDEATLVSVPPYHVAGIAALCSSVYAGRRIVQLPTFDADTWIDLAREESVTHAMVVPTMLARIVQRLNERGDGGVPTLRSLSYGGSKTARPVIERALELLPETNFVNAYGLTETSSTIAVLGPEDHRSALASPDPAVRRRLRSGGKPLPSVEVSIRDEAGVELCVGESGEIWVRGEQISGEYLGQDPPTNPGGWFHTKDGGFMDDEGYLYVEGRLDDVIIRGGENISPGEIEDVLLSHGAIRDAAAVGIADAEWGEVIGVAIVLADSVDLPAQTVKAFVRERLRSSRTPDIVVVMDELPYSETGKLLRRVLREQLTAPTGEAAQGQSQL